mmetsp:Transcript_8917/g.20100  ORF Transcript_8917/g.20100 Transcript_8917/m.20100 type:complete len:236 (+) Transcript_8917:505-1212(+)
MSWPGRTMAKEPSHLSSLCWAAAALSASSLEALASSTPHAFRMLNGKSPRRSTPMELMRMHRFLAPPFRAGLARHASRTFRTPSSSTRFGVFPPRHARVGKAVVPVTTTTASHSARAGPSVSGLVVSASTTSIAAASAIPSKKPRQRSASRATARTLATPRSASRSATSRPTLPDAPMIATRSPAPTVAEFSALRGLLGALKNLEKSGNSKPAPRLHSRVGRRAGVRRGAKGVTD